MQFSRYDSLRAFKYGPSFDLDDAFAFFKDNGCLLISDVLSYSSIDEYKREAYDLFNEEVRHGVEVHYAPNVDRIWNLVNKRQLFQALVTLPLVSKLMNLVFDRETHHQKFFLTSCQATIMRPGAKRQRLHIDAPVPDPLPPWEVKANTIWLLDDFTAENGATEVIRRSHRFGRRPALHEFDDHPKVEKVIAPAGSVLVTSGYLWHRAGSNRSDKDRMALLAAFASSAMREISSEEDIVRRSLKDPHFKITKECWRLVGGEHGVRPGI
jgi:Phytanoyl-CoA dioxygenase (PhyH)